MMYRSSLFFVLLVMALLPATTDAFSQDRSVLKGKVVDEYSGRAVEYAYIQNYSRKSNTYSNVVGDFTVEAVPGDTLVLYGLGYFYKKVIVLPEMIDPQHIPELTLKQQAYGIAEAKIVGYGTYNQFKQRFLDLDQPRTPTETLNEQMAEVSRNVAVEAYQKAQAEKKLDGVTFAAVPILTPEEKERIKLGRIIKKEQIRDQIYQKFNPMVVRSVTGIKDDDEVISFMVFCDFPDKYLLETDEYELRTRIALKYEMYKRKLKDDELMKNPVNRIDGPFETLS
ncbi:MAG: hypothetical protein JXA72_03385 [Bacteroidales bacterium]|nr:hypothetical protein [Bacteroidales bacterium]